MAKTSAKVKDRWNKKAYDSILIRVKKGNKEIIQQKADEESKSLNGYIVEAIEEKIKKTNI